MSKIKSDLVMANGKAYHLGLAADQIYPNIFLVGDPARAHLIASRFEDIHHQIQHREYVTISGSYQRIPMTVIGTGIGTDNVEIALIEAYGLLAFNSELEKKKEHPNMKVIRIGTSGGIQPDIEPGTVAITSYAIGLDSTGLYFDHPASKDVEELELQCLDLLDKHVSPQSRFKGRIPIYGSKAHTKVHDALLQAAAGLNPITGITVSTPSFYGASGRYIQGLTNTVPNIKSALTELNFRGSRIVNMEMESSLIFHLCGNLGVPSGTICPIISKPHSHENVVDYASMINQAVEVGLEAMVSLIP